MMLPRVARGDGVVFKAFYDPENALRELQMSRILSSAMLECLSNYSQDLRHLIVFEWATPLPELEPSLDTGLEVFSGLMSGIHYLHNVFGVTHNAITPDHVVRDQENEWKLIDGKHITALGVPQRLRDGMRGGFTCADAIAGGQRVEERHARYSAAVTSLWAIRRAHSFVDLQDPIYKLGEALLKAGNLDEARSVWALRDPELPLLPHLVGGFQQEVLDCSRANAAPAMPPAPVAKDSTPAASDRPTIQKRKAPDSPSEAPAPRRSHRTRA
jgi:hypothetical protein